jgi:formamidopyrimidine-DNA glycosylase
MFELPEFVVLAGQINESLTGSVVRRGKLGNSPHKFVWYNRAPGEFEKLIRGKKIGRARARGKWLFVPLDPGFVLLLGECGGKLLLHDAGAKIPGKFHLLLEFEDGRFLSATTQMWGAYELYRAGDELERKYIKGMRPTPLDREFSYGYFVALVDSQREGQKRSVKGLLTQEQLIPGLGNAIAQDILFRAGLHPRRPLEELSRRDLRALYQAILKTVREIIAKGGRDDETDLHGSPGRYIRVMGSRSAGRPCPRCRTRVEKIQYLGGACYFCPRCQT